MASRIKVTFPNGNVSCYRSPVYTVIDVLRWIGPDRFHEIDFTTGGQRIVTKTVPDSFKNYSKEIEPGWFYVHRSDTWEKTNLLINLNRQFNLNLQIEEGQFDGKQNPPISGRTKPKNWIVDTMPDGSVIESYSYKGVFLKCIQELGPRKVSSKANFPVNRNRDLFSSTNLNGNRQQMDDHLYMEIPNTTKDAFKYLKLIASRLGINLQVEYMTDSKQKGSLELHADSHLDI